MKIGILTLPLHENYGGILQAVALYRFLHSQGHDVVLVDKQTQNNQVLWKKFTREVFLKIPFYDFKNLKINQARLERIKFHRAFIEKEIFKISKSTYTKQDLEDFVKKEKLDAVIVGSDQVWRRAYMNGKNYKNYFLDFVDGSKIKKIAYAASFGKDHWEGEGDEEDISNLLKDFTAISTRELSGTQICKDSFNYKHAKHVLDPTMLMNKEFYIDEIISKYDISSVSKGGLVTYVLDEAEEKKEVINSVKDNLNIKHINNIKGFNSSKTTYSVSEWLTSFAYADFIVTDSFHGCIFAILFNKPFIVFANEKRGVDRFLSVLDLFSLNDRMIFSLDAFNHMIINQEIDWSAVNKQLNLMREKSFDFLITNLEN